MLVDYFSDAYARLRDERRRRTVRANFSPLAREERHRSRDRNSSRLRAANNAVIVRGTRDAGKKKGNGRRMETKER